MPLLSAQRWNRIGDRAWSALIPLFYFIMRLLPARMASDLGDRLGRRFGRSRSPLSSLAAEENLGRIRPGDPAALRAGTVDRMWAHVGRLQAETVVIDRLWKAAEITVRNDACVRGALLARRPIVFVFAHLGNWELLAVAAHELGVKLNVIYEILPDPAELRLALRARRRLGYRLIAPDRAGTRQMLAALGRGEALGLALDEFKDGNVLAPAFGRPPRVRTNAKYAAKLASRFNALVIPCYCLRTAPFAFELTFLDPMERPSVGALEALCEAWIREHPEQWYMLPRLRLPPA